MITRLIAAILCMMWFDAQADLARLTVRYGPERAAELLRAQWFVGAVLGIVFLLTLVGLTWLISHLRGNLDA